MEVKSDIRVDNGGVDRLTGGGTGTQQLHSFALDSLEPVKPPRRKRHARLELQQQVKSQPPLDISAPVLVTSTLNPNDTDSHKSLLDLKKQVKLQRFGKYDIIQETN